MTENKDPPDLQSVTADHVAARAGVSRWTVARAFKKDASISAKSRRKVLDAAESLGYVPDLLAAGLASDRSNLVALLVDDFNNPHKLVMLERLTRILRAEGWGTLLVNTLGQHDTSSALLNASQMRVDAAVLIGTSFDEHAMQTALGARRVRKLIVFARVSRATNTISICCDDAAAMREIAAYVLDKGYRRPLFLAGPDTQSAVLMRKETFAASWLEANGTAPTVLHVPQYDMALAFDRLLPHLRSLPSSQRPDIVVCENDVLAIGAMDAIRTGLGLSVPQEIAVTGFDDIPLAASPGYDLTTYRQPITDMVHALIGVLQSADGEAANVSLKGRFVARSSA